MQDSLSKLLDQNKNLFPLQTLKEPQIISISFALRA